MGDEHGRNIIDLARQVQANAWPAGRVLAVGEVVNHAQFGIGTVTQISGRGDATKATVQFERVGIKELLPRYAPITKVSSNGAAEQVVTDMFMDDLYLPRSALAELPRGEPLIDGVIDKHSLFVVAGRDQTYKSFLVLDWLACLATGRPWMGREVEQTNVLYVVGEGAWGLNARLTAWETAWGQQVEDHWFTVRRAPVNLFRQASAFEDLLARIKLEGYGVVVFDTLQRMASGADQNSARDAGVIVESLDEVRKATGGAAGVVAHSDKGDNDTRGSSAFEDDADIVWRTKKDEDEQTIKVVLTKRKDGPDGLTIDLRPKLVEGTGSLVLESARGLPPATEPRHSVTVLKVLAGSAVPADGLAATAIRDAVGLSGKGSVHNVLSWLIDKQYVRKCELGRWPSYKITDEGSSKLLSIDEHPH